MGIADSPFESLIGVVRYLVSWGEAESGVSREFWMPDSSCGMCYECDLRFTVINRRHHCRSCGRLFCLRCMQDTAEGETKFCKFCFQAIGVAAEMKPNEFDKKSEPPVISPEQSVDGRKPFQNGGLEKFLRLHEESSSSPHAGHSSCATSSVDPFSPYSFQCSGSRY